MNTSNFFSVNLVQFAQSIAVGVISAVVMYLNGVVNTPNFDLYTFHWSVIVNVAFIAFISTLATHLLTTSDGKLLGAIRVQ